MDTIEMDSSLSMQAPRTVGAVVLLGVFAIVLSWLAVYAAPSALIAAGVMMPWPQGSDPRPQWLVYSFVCLSGSFAVLGGLARWMSGRQLRRIDRMADAEEVHYYY